jgi:hypothetical protein
MTAIVFISHGDRRTELAECLRGLSNSALENVDSTFFGPPLNQTWARGVGEEWRAMMVRRPGWIAAEEGARIPLPGGGYG